MHVAVGGTYTVGARRNYKPSSRPAIIVCPPRGQTHQQQFTVGWIGHVTQKLAEAGFPVVSATMSSTASWGNTAARTAVGTTRTTAISTYAAQDAPVGILASSMGTLSGLGYAKDNPANVGAFCSAVPVVDLSDIYALRADYQAEITTAHTDASGYAAYLASENPSSHTGSFDLPVQLHYASNDPNITPSTVTSFASAVGGEAINLGAVGHTPTTVDADTVVAFFEENL